MANPTTPDPQGASTALAAYSDELGMERLQRRPIIDRINQRQLALIKRTIAVAEGDQAITDAELGHFLELCALYGLDPFAREAWIAKGKTGKLLIMVGRDGLRKIGQRNGLHADGDVVCAKDDFVVEHVTNEEDAKRGEWEANGRRPFHRVRHVKRGMGSVARGPVVGAWCRVTERKSAVECGYFEAPLEEYRPQNASPYSPWSKQVGVMILAAAERQAMRQATPLGGLMAIGEDESANSAAVGRGEGEGYAPGWQGLSVKQAARAEKVVARARELGVAGLSEPGTLQMAVNGQAPHLIDAKLTEWEGVLANVPEPITATVVDEPEPVADDADTLEARALALMADADAAAEDGNEAMADSLGREAAELHDRAQAMREA